MWSLLLYLLLGWFISSVVLHIGERRGIRTTCPSAELPGFMSWWRVFVAPFKVLTRMFKAAVSFLHEFIWRIVKG